MWWISATPIWEILEWEEVEEAERLKVEAAYVRLWALTFDKECTVCRQVLPPERFWRHRRSKTGRDWACIACRRLQMGRISQPRAA